MTSVRALSLFAACWCVTASLVGQGQPQAVRTWVDQTGRMVKGKLLDVQGPNVVLQLENNTNATVPVARFSTADQDYVREWVKSVQKSDPSVAALPLAWPESVAVDARKLQITPGAQNAAERQFIYQSGSFQFTSNAPLTSAVMRDIAGDFELVKTLFEKLPWGWQSKPEGGGPLFLAVLHETETDFINAGGSENTSGRSERGIIYTKFSTLGLKKVGERYARDTRLDRQGEMISLITRLIAGELRYYAMPWSNYGFETFLEEIAYRNGAFQMSRPERGLKEYLASRAQDGLAPDVDAMVKMLHMTGTQEREKQDVETRRLNFFHGAVLFYFLAHLDGDGTGARVHRYYQAVAKHANAWRDYNERRKAGMSVSNPQRVPCAATSVELNNIVIDGRTDDQLRAEIIAKFRGIGIKM